MEKRLRVLFTIPAAIPLNHMHWSFLNMKKGEPGKSVQRQLPRFQQVKGGVRKSTVGGGATVCTARPALPEDPPGFDLQSSCILEVELYPDGICIDLRGLLVVGSCARARCAAVVGYFFFFLIHN